MSLHYFQFINDNYLNLSIYQRFNLINQIYLLIYHTILQLCLHNIAHTTMHTQHCLYNNAHTTLHTQNCLYNNSHSTLHTQNCLYNNAHTKLHTNGYI